MSVSGAADAVTLSQSIQSDMPQLLALYRDLHANPELSMQEQRTPALLAAEMRKLGFEVTEGVGKTGVVAVMRNGPGPVLLIRTDMDALPVKEQTGLPFASSVTGKLPDGTDTPVAHACGHDTHMAAWIGTARRLAAMKDQWSGTLVMIAQPGEEIVAGARAMLEDGLYTRFPKPDYVLAFHDFPIPAGIIGITPGYAMANVDSVDILVHGVGGHGAAPQFTRDPIVLASRIVTTLQTLVSRESNPKDPAVVTVGSFHSGTKNNIIPDQAKLQLTVRSYTPEERQLLLDGINRIARGEGIAAGLPDDKLPEVTVREKESAPAMFNSEDFSGHIQQLFTHHFGPERVRTVPSIMASEDFSRYRLADPSIKSLMFWVGAVPKAKWAAAGGDPQKLPGLHSPFWAPDSEAVISTATEAMIVAALDILKAD